MLAFVLNRHGEPLMPCKACRARKLLDAGKAKVVRRTPFTIKLLHSSSGYKQPVTAGMDTGSKTVGCAATANSAVLYQSETRLRTDVSKKMQQRAMYRRNRRGRKCRYRAPRFLNRSASRRKGRLAPSLQSKLNSHLREKRFVESILPVTHWKVETAQFDIHKITNPDVSGADYQQGAMLGWYNVKAYVLHRDGHQCQAKRKGVKHSAKLHVHHRVFRSNGGTDAPSNLITLCKRCHADLHNGLFELPAKRSVTKHPTEMGIISAQLNKHWHFETTYGYRTKHQREQVMGLPKSHYFDAVAICCEDGELVLLNATVYQKRHVAGGDYQQRKGKHSEKVIPTGKTLGLRKHDLVQTPQGTGFVKGKRSSGYFALETLTGKRIHASANVKTNAVRLQARTTTLIQPIMEAAIPLGTKVPSILAAI